jgi:outer membrane protein assembly factor BamD (BamD/ComL family)/uncharacterized membrane protein
MSSAVITHHLAHRSFAETALKAAAGFWLLVAVIGQWVFMFYIAAVYGSPTAMRKFEAWNAVRVRLRGYVPGDTIGNISFAAHVLLAGVVAFGGAIQLIPQIRKRAIALHRWNGRVFMITSLGMSISGLYMVWVRSARLNMTSGIAVSLNGALIIAFILLAWRAAVRREIASHRRWALRSYLVANGQWFVRVGLFAWVVINRGPVGIGDNFDGPFILFWAFGCYLAPLAVLELYFRAKDNPSALQRWATAGVLFVLTLAMGAGIAGISAGQWMPTVKAAQDPRKSIGAALYATINSSGVEQAAKQYHDLKATQPTVYRFEENELNNLGYQLLRAKKFKDAIRIFQLNVEANPQSSNVYDSLGEAYMDDGEQQLAIANYKKSLELNPQNRNGAKMLQKLGAPGPARN